MSSRPRTLSLGASAQPPQTPPSDANATAGNNRDDEYDDPYTSDPRLTPTEAEVLLEYKKMLRNLRKVSAQLADLAAQPSTSIADGLRALERKTTLVHTALKSSVYSIVLQQQIEYSGSANGSGGGAGRSGYAEDEDNDDTARLGR